jgi:hypothetical protein
MIGNCTPLHCRGTESKVSRGLSHCLESDQRHGLGQATKLGSFVAAMYAVTAEEARSAVQECSGGVQRASPGWTISFRHSCMCFDNWLLEADKSSLVCAFDVEYKVFEMATLFVD